jgi:hypothetical protein
MQCRLVPRRRRRDREMSSNDINDLTLFEGNIVTCPTCRKPAIVRTRDSKPLGEKDPTGYIIAHESQEGSYVCIWKQQQYYMFPDDVTTAEVDRIKRGDLRDGDLERIRTRFTIERQPIEDWILQHKWLDDLSSGKITREGKRRREKEEEK